MRTGSLLCEEATCAIEAIALCGNRAYSITFPSYWCDKCHVIWLQWMRLACVTYVNDARIFYTGSSCCVGWQQTPTNNITRIDAFGAAVARVGIETKKTKYCEHSHCFRLWTASMSVDSSLYAAGDDGTTLHLWANPPDMRRPRSMLQLPQERTLRCRQSVDSAASRRGAQQRRRLVLAASNNRSWPSTSLTLGYVHCVLSKLMLCWSYWCETPS